MKIYGRFFLIINKLSVSLQKFLTKMRICAFSDMHGNLKFDVEPCDMVLICGDIVPLHAQTNSKVSRSWLKNTFIPWCSALPCEKVLVVAGNHDFELALHGSRFKAMLKDQDKIVYLDCEAYEYNGVKVFGTPLCKIFGTWAFMSPYDEQDQIYDKVMKKVGKFDILMSHDAPYGVSDIILQKDCRWADGSHIGNKSLTRLVENMKPRIMVHGHLHSCNHDKEMLGDTEVYTVSLLDEHYDLAYKPFYFDFTSD